MGLLDKFKKKEAASPAPVETVEAQPVAVKNENQTVVSEVSVDNNPFVEQVAPVEETVTPESPSFDNIFNAQPSDLIIPEVETAAVVDNPQSTAPEQMAISVDPTAVFEGGDTTYDEITELVSESVAASEASMSENASSESTNVVEEAAAEDKTEENAELNQPVVDVEPVEESVSGELQPVEEQSNTETENQISITSAPILDAVEAPVVEEPKEENIASVEEETPSEEISQNAEESVIELTPTKENAEVVEETSELIPITEEVTPVEVEGTIEENNTEKVETPAEPVYDEPIEDIKVNENFIPKEIIESQAEKIEEPTEEVPEEEMPVFELTNDQMIENPKIDIPMVDVEVEEQEPSSELQPVEISNEPIEDIVSKEIVIPELTQENEEAKEVPESQEVVDVIPIGEPAAISVEEPTIEVSPEITEITPAEQPIVEESTDEIVPEGAEITPLEETSVTGALKTTEANDLESPSVEEITEESPKEEQKSLLERTNEMILSSILEDEDEEESSASEEENTPVEESTEENTLISENEESMDTPEGVEENLPVIEEGEENSFEVPEITVDTEKKSVLPKEKIDLPIIASIATKEEIEGPTNTFDDVKNEEDTEENEDIKPIIEEDETVILPILTEEIIGKYKEEKTSTEPIIKPIIEEEPDELNIGSEEIAPVEDSNEGGENLPVIDLEENKSIDVEETSLESEEKNNEIEKVENEEDKEIESEKSEEISKFNFNPFMNIDGLTSENETISPVAVEAKEEIGTYISDPTPTKFCSNCGIMLTDDSSICPSCGEPID